LKAEGEGVVDKTDKMVTTRQAKRSGGKEFEKGHWGGTASVGSERIIN